MRKSDALLEGMTTASRYFFRIVSDCLAAHAEAAEISAGQYRALAILALRGSRSPSTLAEELGVGRPAATKLVDRLERRRLIRRHRHGTDRRRVVLMATDRGRDLVRSVQRCRRARLGRVLAGIDPSAASALQTSLEALNSAFAAAGTTPAGSGGSARGRHARWGEARTGR